MEEKEIKKDLGTTDATSNAVQVIKAAILQSQQRALKAINQEQLENYNSAGETAEFTEINTNPSVQTWKNCCNRFAYTKIYE